ncbi:MAG: hypothetical protein ACREC6_00515, partial [Hyphomicrobiaceae bacterium]
YEEPWKRLESLRKEIADLREKLKRGENTLKELNVQVQVAKGKVEDTSRADQGTPRNTLGIMTADGLTEEFNKFKKEPNKETLALLIQACSRLSGQLRETDKNLAELKCGDEYQTSATNYFELLEVRRTFEANCSAQEQQKAAELRIYDKTKAREDLSDGERARVFQQLVKKGRECITLASHGTLSDTVKSVRSTIDGLELGVDPDAKNRLAQNAEAFERFDPTAFFAAIIAFAMDSLVLFAGIVGARAAVRPIAKRGGYTPQEREEIARAVLASTLRPEPDDDDEIANSKTFLRNLTRENVPQDDFTGRIDLDAVADEEEYQIVQKVMLTDQQYFKFDSSSGCHLVKEKFIHDLCLRIYQRRRRTAARSGQDPDFPPTGSKSTLLDRLSLTEKSGSHSRRTTGESAFRNTLDRRFGPPPWEKQPPKHSPTNPPLQPEGAKPVGPRKTKK